MDGMERFGVALRRKRLEQNLSQERLADLAEMGRSHVNRIETGEIYRPEPETIDKLAAALGITTDDLLENVEPPVMLRDDRGPLAIDLDEDPLLQLYHRMSEPDRRRLVAIADALWRLNEG
jgi:transcriptional regulator with XRE-family HTH domain